MTLSLSWTPDSMLASKSFKWLLAAVQFSRVQRALCVGGSRSLPAAASLAPLLGEDRVHHSEHRLQAAWRLPAVAGASGPGESDLRLPPLASGQCFSDRYEVCCTRRVFFIVSGIRTDWHARLLQ